MSTILCDLTDFQLTAKLSNSGTIADLWSKMKVLRPLKNAPKSRATALGFWFQTDNNRTFQKWN